MPTRARTQPDLADVVALARALERDEQRPARELRERERRLVRELPGGTEDRVAIALGWLDGVERTDDGVASIHRRADMAIRLTGWLITLAAILLGWGSTLAAFYFDGTGRVNAIAVVAVLVGVPFLLLVPFIFAALPPELARRVPGARAIAAKARGLSPGKLAHWLWRAIAREKATLASDRATSPPGFYSSVQTWALLRWSQWFALWFQITVLVASLLLVVFTDLAFGWSTTLTTGDAALDAQRVHRITSTIAWPWAWLAPDAQPSPELITESRYFRVTSLPVSASQAARLGGWWKFVVFTIAVYGVLPRIITVMVAQGRLRAAMRAAALGAPGFSAVLRRLHAARIETAAVAPEAVDPHIPAERSGETARCGLGGVRVVLNWSAVPVDLRTLAAAFPGAQQFNAGGAASVAQDAAVVAQLAAALTENRGDLLILVKGWEPPLMEFVDFVRAMRAAAGSGMAEIIVLPSGIDPSGHGLVAATTAQLKVWRDKLTRVGDPSLRVAADAAEVTAA